MNGDEIQKQKTAYALELLKTPNDPFKAALVVQPNPGLALQVVHEWTNDPFVVAEKERLLSETGAKAFLPSREDAARLAWEMANGEAKGTFFDAKDRIAALKLFGDMMGYIEKPGINVNSNTTITQNRVMVVNNVGSNDDWERKLAAQQRKLVEASAYAA